MPVQTDRARRAIVLAAFHGARANTRREQLPRQRERRLSHGRALRGSA